MKKTVLSAAQTTGNLHLGNYLGSITHWVDMQNSENYDCWFFLADSHAITIDREPAELRASSISTAAMYIACGLDPAKSTIFLQSSVNEHLELAWILNCITPIGWLKRMTQFKDKAQSGLESANLGLLSYPVLMAADILLYGADLVPVGDDQKQHLELTRDIVVTANRRTKCEIFKLPEPLIQGTSSRIMSLRDGMRKMSKSDSSDMSRINLSDNADIIVQKLKKAKTDTISEIYYDKILRPEISNLLNIYANLSGTAIEDISTKYSGKSCSQFKQDLAEIIISRITPISLTYNELMRNQDYVINILRKGQIEASIKAKKTVNIVKDSFGFVNLL